MTTKSLPRELHPLQSESGNITLFFLLLVFVIVGALSYSLYIGRSVQEKIKTSSTADVAALSMANHTAMGLNIISMNNLAVAGNLHVAAAIPFIGRYYAIGNAFLMDTSKTATYLQLMASPDAAAGTSFSTGFSSTQPITGLLMSAAAGNTFVNRTIAKTWFLKTMPNGIQTARLNSPGALAVPTSILGIAQADRSALMQVQRLAQTNTGNAMCHAITASSVSIASERQSVVFWLRGLTKSLGIGGMLDTMLGGIATFESLVNGLGAILDKNIDKGSDALTGEVKGLTGGLACGEFDANWGIDRWGKKSKKRKEVDKRCEQVTKLGGEKGQLFPIPTFDKCGMLTAGNFAAQSQAFADKFNHEDNIGFVYPAVYSEQDLEAFLHSIDHGILIAMPLFLKEELPASNDGKTTRCPTEWRSTTPSGEPVCDALLGGLDLGMASTSSKSRGFETASGGVGSATSAGRGTEARLRDLFGRTQLALGQAKALFRPGDGDPRGSETYSLRPSEPRSQVFDRTRHQLFWPAWRGLNAPPRALDDVLGFLGKR